MIIGQHFAMELIDQASAVQLFKSTAPEWEWLLRQIESEDGRLRFPPQVNQAIVNFKIESYPLLYENESSIGQIFLRAFLSQDELLEHGKRFEAQSPEERGRLLREMANNADAVVNLVVLPETPEEKQRTKEAFDALSPEEQAESTKSTQYLLMGVLSAFFQNLSMMVHGEKLTSLVAQAKAGNDDALCKAIQIDKRILTTIPYFKQRFERATLEQDQVFLDALSYRLTCPPFRGKIRHKSLWMAFAFFDQLGLLDTLKHSEILDLCDEAGVGGYANRIEDVKNLSKRLAEYRSFQGRGLMVSTP